MCKFGDYFLYLDIDEDYGIKNVIGKFKKGDHIKILDKSKNECARGLSSFSSDEIHKILGHHSSIISIYYTLT